MKYKKMLSFSLFVVALASIPFVAISCSKASYKDQIKDRMQKLIDKYKDNKSKSSILNVSLKPTIDMINNEFPEDLDIDYETYNNVISALDLLEKMLDNSN
ncbi:hypothetical protein KQ875_01150 [Mycoplasma zalophi]|uniref:Variable surface lipoprotein n=1 Tax=Mycoplasma zalophi TaxID=191287 RepID=A0ABS6DR01_9MOLU|nr:variable surface lipoprotein [Mycoplasma zalophi]MBU4692201.1 hypothetical protein [Mycoplasma zalophi]